MTFRIHRFITANTIDTAVEYVGGKLFTTKIKDAMPHTGLVTHMPTEANEPIGELDIYQSVRHDQSDPVTLLANQYCHIPLAGTNFPSH